MKSHFFIHLSPGGYGRNHFFARDRDGAYGAILLAQMTGLAFFHKPDFRSFRFLTQSQYIDRAGQNALSASDASFADGFNSHN
jgi:hypothetical protein